MLRRALALGVIGSLGVGAAYLLSGEIVGDYLFQSSALVAVAGLIAGWMAVMSLQFLLAGRGFKVPTTFACLPSSGVW